MKARGEKEREKYDTEEMLMMMMMMADDDNDTDVVWNNVKEAFCGEF